MACSSLLAVAFLEASLRMLTPFPINTHSNKVAHARLGYVLDERFPDVDSRGFRNRDTSLEDAEIIVVGDSFTYGYNVVLEETLPSRLAAKVNRSVYNMGVGSYGIYHYMIILHDLVSIAPPELLLVLFPANDLLLHCSITELPSWQERARLVGLQAPDCEEESTEPVDEWGKGQPVPFRTWLKRQSALAGVVDHVVWDRIKPATDRYQGPAFRFPYGQQVAIGRVQTAHRFTSFENADVRLSYYNSLAIFARAARELAAVGTRFSILTVPSRGRVLSHWARENGFSRTEQFVRLVDSEDSLAAFYSRFFQEQGIAHLDALILVVSAFDAAVRSGNDFYPPEDDGHPLATGYEALATAAAKLIGRSPAPGSADTAQF